MLPVRWKGAHAMKIGDVAKRAGMTSKTIRFYEEAGLLPPPARTPTGYRDYHPEVADRLRFIRRGQAAGLTLQQIRQVLAIHDHGDTVCSHVREVLRSRLDGVRSQIAELVALEGHLESLLQRAEQEPPSDHDQSIVCWILDNDLDGTPTSEPSDTSA